MPFRKHHKRSSAHKSSFFAGLNSIVFDTRTFDVSIEDLKNICRYFCIGSIQKYKKEAGITVAHSNFIIFITTDLGKYTLKFYHPADKNIITTELFINRVLTRNKFLTPAMHSSSTSEMTLKIKEYLVACYDFIPGKPAYQKNIVSSDIVQVCRGLLELKEILSSNKELTLILNKESFIQRPTSLLATLNTMKDFPQKTRIKALIVDLHKTFEKGRTNFIQRPVHANLSLANMLFHNNKIFFLDLSHIRIDNELADLSSLIISSLFFSVPSTTIQAIIMEYFFQHKTTPDKLMTLKTLLQINLVKEYLKTEKKVQSKDLENSAAPLLIAYLEEVKNRKEMILGLLEMFNKKKRPPIFPLSIYKRINSLC